MSQMEQVKKASGLSHEAVVTETARWSGRKQGTGEPGPSLEDGDVSTQAGVAQAGTAGEPFSRTPSPQLFVRSQ